MLNKSPTPRRLRRAGEPALPFTRRVRRMGVFCSFLNSEPVSPIPRRLRRRRAGEPTLSFQPVSPEPTSSFRRAGESCGSVLVLEF